MTAQATHTKISVSSDEKQAIYERLAKRNDIRRQSSLPLLDIPTLYEKKIAALEKAKFYEAIQPHLRDAYRLYPGKPGIPSRFKQHIDVVTHAASAAGFSMDEIPDITFQEFLRLYTSSQLPLVDLNTDNTEPVTT